MHCVYRDGIAVKESTFHSAMECAAFILMKGWIETVERYGVIWAKGIEIRKV